MRRPALLFLVFAAAGCSSRGDPPAPAPAAPAAVEAPPAPPPVPAPAPVAGDAPLPAADEVPGFLRGELPVPTDTPLRETEAALAWSDEPAREPTLRELMRGVRIEDGGEEEGFAVVQGSSEDAPGAHGTRPAGNSLAELMRGVHVGDADADDGGESWAFIGGADEGGEAAESEAAEAVAAAPAAAVAPPEEPVPAPPPEEPEDACAELRRLLDKRNDYLRRTAAERDTFGYVQSAEDQQALRLLQGLRRCAEHPDDADCRQRPIEVDIDDLVIPSHQIERDPSDLNAEGRNPDEIPHDPQVLELLHQLKACERRAVAQPLLQRGSR